MTVDDAADRDDPGLGRRVALLALAVVARRGHDDHVASVRIGERVGHGRVAEPAAEAEVDDVGAVVGRPDDAGSNVEHRAHTLTVEHLDRQHLAAPAHAGGPAAGITGRGGDERRLGAVIGVVGGVGIAVDEVVARKDPAGEVADRIDPRVDDGDDDRRSARRDTPRRRCADAAHRRLLLWPVRIGRHPFEGADLLVGLGGVDVGHSAETAHCVEGPAGRHLDGRGADRVDRGGDATGAARRRGDGGRVECAVRGDRDGDHARRGVTDGRCRLRRCRLRRGSTPDHEVDGEHRGRHCRREAHEGPPPDGRTHAAASRSARPSASASRPLTTYCPAARSEKTTPGTRNT